MPLQRTIKPTRFYKPTLATLTDKEFAFAQKNLDESYRYTSGFDFILPKVKYPITTKRIGMQYVNKPENFEPEYFNMGNFQILYRFSSALRKNLFPLQIEAMVGQKVMREYGASGFSYRMLYEFLCVNYNNNEPFIDTYFESVFKTRAVHSRFLGIYDEIQDDINNEQLDLFMSLPLKADGTPDMRYAESKKFMDFKVWQDPIKRQGCKRIAEEIKKDIKACLSTNKIPLAQGGRVSRYTTHIRNKMVGLHPKQLFFASGNLIDHLSIYIKIGDNTQTEGRAA